MTHEQFVMCVEGVTLKHPPFRIEIGKTFHRYPDLKRTDAQILVKWWVPDRDHGDPISVNHWATVNSDMPAALIEHALEKAFSVPFQHEFQESLHVQGVRIRDPHPAQLEKKPVMYYAKIITDA